MKITYRPETRSLEFTDGIKTSYRFILFLLILNIVNALLNLYNKQWALSGLNLLWVFIGGVSFLGLVFLWLRKDLRQRIPLSEVTQLKEKTFFGTRRFSLKLKNGKNRDIIGLKTPEEVSAFIQLMQQLGVATS